jgi:hypothetical protein
MAQGFRRCFGKTTEVYFIHMLEMVLPYFSCILQIENCIQESAVSNVV